MQKTEYICDRCGVIDLAERMNRLCVTPVFVLDRSITEAREMLEKLKRTAVDKVSGDLCNDCAGNLKDWLREKAHGTS